MTSIPLPSVENGRVVVGAPGEGPGNWAGAPHATVIDGVYWLSYRIRHSDSAAAEDTRGVATVVARSADGESFETVAMVSRSMFVAQSMERPSLVRKPDGGWRLYVCCATPESKHWWVEAIDADNPEDLADGERTVVFPGSGDLAVKDPIVTVDRSGWKAWLCCHPLTEPGQEDRMSTAFATSDDGLVWEWHGEVLRPRPGSWDQRGARMTTVVRTDPLVVLYDGRATAEDNWHEVTGIAREKDGLLVADETGPVARSPHSDGGLRYASAVALPDGSTRFYFEAARPDGAHDLYTSLSR
jgi:hypothetical protein